MLELAGGESRILPTARRIRGLTDFTTARAEMAGEGVAEELVGRRLGEYRIEAALGRGGMGQVYRARHVTLDRVCAVKILSAQLVADPVYRGRFLQEARAVARLNHPNIVTVYDAGVSDGNYYIAMQFVDGVSLNERLARGPLSLDEALEIIAPVAAALDYAHAQGLVHRDVKPGNILIGSDGHVFLADFGIARTVTQDVRLTTSGMMVGTPAYMAPEQITGGEVTAQTDIYQLGVTFFELITGESPYTERAAHALLMAHFQEQPRSAHDLNPALAPAVSDVIDGALRKQPDDRYRSAGEFVAEIERITDPTTLGSVSTVAVPAGGNSPAPRIADPNATTLRPEPAIADMTPATGSEQQPWRGRLRYVLAAGVAVALLVVAVIWWAPWESDNGGGSGQPPAVGEVVDAPDREQLWPQELGDAGSSFVDNGIYYLVIQASDQEIMQQALGSSFGDGSARLEVMMDALSGSYQEACLLARIERTTDITRAYRYCLTDSAETYVSYIELDQQDEQLVEEELVRFGIAPGTFAPTDWNELEIIAQGDALWFRINDSLSGSIQHDGPAVGEVGIAVYRAGAGEAKFAFGHLALAELAED